MSREADRKYVELPKFEAVGIDDHGLLTICDDRGKAIRSITVEGLPFEQLREIVRRCNAVPDAIKALEVLADMKSYRLGRHALKIHPSQIAKTALAKLKGENRCQQSQKND